MNGTLRRAWITGIGILAPIGKDRTTFWEGVRLAISGLAPITGFDTAPFRTPFGGELCDVDPSELLSEEEIDRFPDKNIQMALMAAKQALSDAGFTAECPPPKTMGIVVGTCNGGLDTAERHYQRILDDSSYRAEGKTVSLLRYHCLGKALAFAVGACGPVWVVTTACSSSTGALGLALELIQQGICDTLLVGGSDTLCRPTMAGFDAIRATSTTQTAPFSTPVGLNLGEGAAFWVVEESEKASKRRAEADGAILGYSLSSDAHHPTAPDPMGRGALRTMTEALSRSGIGVSEIGCVNGHGTGTEANDRAESKAVSKLLSDRSLPVYSFKSQVGHCLGAAGIIEATAGLLAMNHNLIPATINFGGPRPGCDLYYVPNKPIERPYHAFLSCNYAFGGNNAAVVIGASEQPNQDVAELPSHRTFLSGAGMVTPCGVGASANLSAFRRGVRGLSPIPENPWGTMTASLAGFIKDFDGKTVDRRIDFRPMQPISQFATAAARLALADAGVRISPKEGEKTGVINGVYVGPRDENFLTSVIRTCGREVDVTEFSHVVANATGGWVSNALALKGYSSSVAEGADAGLFALLMAHYAVGSGAAGRILAGAADALHPRYLKDYDEAGLLHSGGDEQHFGLRFQIPLRRVLGEGAAYLVAETMELAKSRGHSPVAELVGHGMSTDPAGVDDPNPSGEGLILAITEALHRAGWQPKDVAMLTWTPQGNRSDRRAVDAVLSVFGSFAELIPWVTSVFHTGLMESASGTATLAAVLEAWKSGTPLWSQITGVEGFDASPLPTGPCNTLAIATSDIGFNLALAIAPAPGEAGP